MSANFSELIFAVSGFGLRVNVKSETVERLVAGTRKCRTSTIDCLVTHQVVSCLLPAAQTTR
jgi:hypothetical protein